MMTADGKNFNILCLEGVVFLSILLGVLGQSISSSVSFALIIIDSEVVTREFLGPANLSGAQTLCVYKLSEVIMVGKDKNFISRVL